MYNDNVHCLLGNMEVQKRESLPAHVLLLLVEKDGQRGCQGPCSGGAIGCLEIMNICASAAQVATTYSEVTPRKRGHNNHLFLI